MAPPQQSVPSLTPVVPRCRIRPHRVYSLDRVCKITGLSRAALQRLADAGEVRSIKTGKRSVAFGGITVLMLLGMPTPEIPLTTTPTETPTQRRTRGQQALNQALKTKGRQS